MSADRHISVTLRYVKPVDYCVAHVEQGLSDFETADSYATAIMDRDDNVYEAVVSVAYIDRQRERRMVEADRACGLLPKERD